MPADYHCIIRIVAIMRDSQYSPIKKPYSCRPTQRTISDSTVVVVDKIVWQVNKHERLSQRVRQSKVMSPRWAVKFTPIELDETPQ